MSIPKMKVFRSYKTWRSKALRHGNVEGDEFGAVAGGDATGIGIGEWKLDKSARRQGYIGYLTGYLTGLPRAAHKIMTGFKD